jgi:hypothetical protein
MRTYTAVILVLALAGTAPASQGKVDPDARTDAVAPYLDDQVFAVARVDLSRVKPEAILAKVADWGNLKPGELAVAEKMANYWLEKFTKAKGKEIYFVFSLADVQLGADHSTPIAVVPLDEGADAETIAGLLGICFPKAEKPAKRRAVVAGSKAALKRIQSLKPTRRPELVKAFKAAGETTAQLLILPTPDMRRVIEEALPTLPKEIGGGPGKAVSRGLLWAALGIDLPPQLGLNLTIQSEDQAAAKALRTLIANFLKIAGEQEEVREYLPEFKKVADGLTPRRAGDRLTLTDKGENLAKLLAAFTQRGWQALRDAQTSANLSRIGIAMHRYHDDHKEFPAAATYDKQGTPLLSWRVHLLPYLGQTKLYKEFHLNEPWDSAHNRKLIKRMPAVYSSGSSQLSGAGKTTLLAPVGKGTMFPGQKPLRMPFDIPDGTSNTIFLVAAMDDRAVVWTRPEDLPVDPKKPFAGLTGKKKKSFLALAVDGSVQCVPAGTDPKTLVALFTPNGGEVVGFPGCST